MTRSFTHLFSITLITLACAGCDWGRSAQLHEVFLSEALPPLLEAFRKDIGRYPTQEEGFAALISAPESIKDRWHGPYLASAKDGKIVQDPWGHDYVYRRPSQEKGKSYDLICRGPSGKEDYYVFSK